LNLLTAAAVTSQIIMSVQALGSIRALDFFLGKKYLEGHATNRNDVYIQMVCHRCLQ